jgi:CRP-like cAMP-binding protein
MPHSELPPESLRTQLQGLIPLTDADYAAFIAALQPMQLAKKELLLREGEVCREVAYVERGGLRYFYNVDGEERTGQFFFEGSWYADYDSFLDQKPSRQSIEAIEPARLWLLPRADLYRGSRARSAALLNQTPAERYEQLLRTRPELVQRVSQRLLATYLGIKPESLSRIRGRS